jgi:hypothetical protein
MHQLTSVGLLILLEQDRVPAFSSDKAVAIIEKDLGQPINTVRNTSLSQLLQGLHPPPPPCSGLLL